MELNDKIGIWGYQTVGKSVLNFLLKRNFTNIEIYDVRQLNDEEANYLNQHNINYNQTKNLKKFLKENNYIIASPGVNISPYYKEFGHKFIAEVDIFFSYWKKKVIAITGTVGKTSTLILLETILKNKNIKVISGGNSGRALCDLIEYQEENDIALIELSSFQLEYSRACQPDIIIWTNFYANHLDRHLNIDNYFKAKCNIFINNKKEQKIIVPLDLKNILEKQKISSKSFIYFSERKNKYTNFDGILFTFEKNSLIKLEHNKKFNLIHKSQLPQISYSSNWLAISAICHTMNINIEQLQNTLDFKLPKHRLEFIDSINEVHFFNDSKSTVPQATIAAVNYLFSKFNKPIHLFVGGLSKSVDRSTLFESIKEKISFVYCFGNEAELLYQYAKIFGIKAEKFKTLDQAFQACNLQTKPTDIVLFSPSGSSFDQFKNFEERGTYFNNLITSYKKKETNEKLNDFNVCNA